VKLEVGIVGNLINCIFITSIVCEEISKSFTQKFF